MDGGGGDLVADISLVCTLYVAVMWQRWQQKRISCGATGDPAHVSVIEWRGFRRHAMYGAATEW